MVEFRSHNNGYYLSFPYDADFIADLKAMPWHARRYDPDKKLWWVDELYFNCVADFVLAHYGIDLTPERNNPVVPCIELIVRDVYSNE